MSAELPISAESAEWLRQALRDTFNADFMGAYQREQVGPVPADLCEWAGIDPVLFMEHEAEPDDYEDTAAEVAYWRSLMHGDGAA